LVPLLPAQQSSSVLSQGGFLRNLTNRYTPKPIAPANFSNSNRLDALLRGGNLYLSLQDAIALAIENNLDIEIQRLGPLTAQLSLARTQTGSFTRGSSPAVVAGPSSAGGGGSGFTSPGVGNVATSGGPALFNFDPVFTSTVTAGHQTRPQANTITTGLTATTTDFMSQTYGITKGWITGTTSTLNWTYNGTRSNSPANDINPSKNSNVQLVVTQKLLQGFGRAVNGRNIRVAKNNIKLADYQFELQLINTVSSITGLYWDLVSYNEDLKVKQQALALAQKLFEDNKKQVEIGTLAPIEIVSAEAQVAAREQDLVISETVLKQQETIIKNSLSRLGVSNLQLSEARIIPTDRIRVDPVEPIQPIQDLVALALQKRPDFKQTTLNIENAKIGLEGTKSQMLPTVDITGTLQNNALAGQINTIQFATPRPRDVDKFFIGGFGDAAGQLLRRNFPDYSVSFNLNIPLRNRAIQDDMAIDQLSVRTAELQQQRTVNQLRVDVQNAVTAVQQARARYETALKQRTLQEQTLDAEQKKYALGASTAFFVIQYQRDLAQAQSNEVAALSNYAKAKTEMSRVTGQTLEVSNVTIGEAVSGRVSRAPAALPPPGQ
jgi:outer membrane protein TolC